MQSGWMPGRWRLPGRATREAAALLALCVAAGLAAGAGLHTLLHRQSRPAHAHALAGPPDCSLVLFGDSILDGAQNGLQRLDEPPAALRQRLRPRDQLLDPSHAGDSERLHAPRCQRTPPRGRLVMLQWGTHDAGQNTACTPLAKAMRAGVEREADTRQVERAQVTSLAAPDARHAPREPHPRLQRLPNLCDIGADHAQAGGRRIRTDRPCTPGEI